MRGVTASPARTRRRAARRVLDAARRAARVRRIRDRLREVYGVPLMAPHGHPIAELVLTVLSQSTNDRNRDVAYLRLRERLPTWEQVRDAPLAEVEEAIRPGGISKVKSARIQAILRAITDEPAATPAERAVARLAAARAARARRATTSSRCRASGARRRRACCCSPTACATCPSTRTSRASAARLRAAARGRPVRGAARRDARADAARARSSSCTSTCCATAGAPATRGARPAADARSRGCARAAGCSTAGRSAARQHGEGDHRVVQRRRRRSRARGRPRGSRTPSATGSGRPLA